MKRLRDSLNYDLSFASLVLNECLLVGLSAEYSGYSHMGAVSLNAILLQDGRIETPFADLNITNPALLVKATEDNRIYLFDGATNSVNILDYLRN